MIDVIGSCPFLAVDIATLPGCDQAGFAVWRSLSSAYVVSDLRDGVIGFVETVYMTLGDALASVAAVVGA